MKFYEVHQGVLTKTGTGDFYQLARFDNMEDAIEYFNLVKNDLRGINKRKILHTFIVELDDNVKDYEVFLYEFEIVKGGER